MMVAERLPNRLFPAHAGVILSSPAIAITEATVPRTRGGDPILIDIEGRPINCSPHTRG